MARGANSGKAAGPAVGCLVALVVLAAVIFRPWVTVPAGHRAVLFSLSQGTLSRQLGEGTSFIVPFVQRPIFYDVRTQTYTMSGTHWEGEVSGDDSLSTLSKDGQVLNIEISVRFHPDPDHVWRLHQKVGQDYINKLIRPAIRSLTRAVVAEYPVDDVYSLKRQEVERQIAGRLTKSLASNDIVVDEVLPPDIRFSPAFAGAIEQKQIAQQEAQRMQYVLEKAALEKQQKILEAQGDARSIALRGAAIRQSARVVQYEYARKIAPNVTTIVTDGKSVSVPFAARPAPAPR